MKWYYMIPCFIRCRLRPLYAKVYRSLPKPWWQPESQTAVKHNAALKYWENRYEAEGCRFNNGHYERIMLAMAGEADAAFAEGKIVADFGCGARGSLVWATGAKVRIGVDVLATQYFEHFADNLMRHQMIYLQSTENMIPLPSDYVDVFYTLNAIDHVDDFKSMVLEMIRVLKPGGDFIASINMCEPPSVKEPQTLTEDMVSEVLLPYLDVVSYRIARVNPTGNSYQNLFDNNLEYTKGEPGHLWVRGRKKNHLAAGTETEP